eukprot:gb/GECG01013253.1/.p1 GENE.gb/GECG01013253.1/~~gb/GECG01013253.1/.p1  ORF type:complete len:222 (+),score=24.33 gb/GECG01013253.1/:1-666(+)
MWSLKTRGIGLATARESMRHLSLRPLCTSHSACKALSTHALQSSVYEMCYSQNSALLTQKEVVKTAVDDGKSTASRPRGARALSSSSPLCFSSSEEASSNRRPLDPESWSESDYNQVAEQYLEDLEEALGVLEDKVDGFDMFNSQGVLTVNLGEQGTYVINKQTPNRQIWWSSPISGPKRYYYDANSGRWLNTRDDSLLEKLLYDEIKELLGTELELSIRE